MVLATLDESWVPDLDLPAVLKIVRLCITQLSGRYSLAPQSWRINVVDSTGARLAELLS